MRLHRREWLGGFAGGATAFGFDRLIYSVPSAAAAMAARPAPFRRCLIMWMEGGPSQLDTFDPKAGGPRESVATDLKDVRLADTLPGLASRVQDLCLVRSVGSREGEHTRATELMHTGFTPSPSFPRPSLGSMVVHGQKPQDFPRYVTLGGAGFGPAFLGATQGPFVIEDLTSVHKQLERIESKRRSVDLLRDLNRNHSSIDNGAIVSARANAVESVGKLLDTMFPQALDLQRASDEDRHRYGDQPFGRRMLAARRLLELGVPFVEAQLSGWDTHIDNQAKTNELCRQLEQPFLSLVDDLQQRGLWKETLVVWMGEFGRTPSLNGRSGRDHFPEAIPVVLAGGSLGGQVIGETSDDGSRRIGPRHSVADLMATLLTLMGLDVEQSYTTDFGSPTTMTDSGQPIEAIVSVGR
ncbi:MAG: DUF1501 domain-containing protein [Rubripirellula sp.]